MFAFLSGSPVELRGFQWGTEPEDDKPGWPANGAPDDHPDGAPGPADGQASSWWPEAGDDNGTTGSNGDAPMGMAGRRPLGRQRGNRWPGRPGAPGASHGTVRGPVGQQSPDSPTGEGHGAMGSGGSLPPPNGRAQRAGPDHHKQGRAPGRKARYAGRGNGS